MMRMTAPPMAMAMMVPWERMGLLVLLEVEVGGLDVGLEREFWVVPKKFSGEVELGRRPGGGYELEGLMKGGGKDSDLPANSLVLAAVLVAAAWLVFVVPMRNKIDVPEVAHENEVRVISPSEGGTRKKVAQAGAV